MVEYRSLLHVLASVLLQPPSLSLHRTYSLVRLEVALTPPMLRSNNLPLFLCFAWSLVDADSALQNAQGSSD